MVSPTGCGANVLASLFLLAAITANAERPPPCKILLTAKVAGEPVFLEDVTPAECPVKRIEVQLRYDARRHIVVAKTAMSPGTPLGLAYVPRRPAILSGEAVRIEARIGHVFITRTAIALGPAEFGQQFHVRTTDGLVLRAPALAETQTPNESQQ